MRPEKAMRQRPVTWLAVAVAAFVCTAPASAQTTAPGQPRVAHRPGNAVSFEERHDATGDATFVLRGKRYRLLLDRDAAVLSLGNKTSAPVRIQLLNADDVKGLTGLEPLPGK